MKKALYIFLILVSIHLFEPDQAASKTNRDVHKWPISNYELKHLKSAFKQYGKKNWKSSILRDYNPKDPVIKKVLKWREFTSGSPATTFKEITEFIRYNPNWPYQELLRRRAEGAINSFTDPDDIIKWFAINPPIIDRKIRFKRPLTAVGKLKLAEAMIKSYKKYKIDKRLILVLIKEAFVEMDFTAASEKRFLTRYRKVIKSKDFQKRVDRLLSKRKTVAASRLYKYLNSDYKKVYSAKVKLIKGSKGVDAAIAAVPGKYRDDEDLVYERVKWKDKRKDVDGVVRLVKKLPSTLSNPKKWSKIRQKYISKLIDRKKYYDAYVLARFHSFKKDKAKIADFEWKAGWLSLRFLKNYSQAYNHFKRMYDIVETPVSISRATYWMGRALEAKGNKLAANKWYGIASKYSVTFYGQLAMAKVGDLRINIPIHSKISSRDLNAYRNNELAKAAFMMFKIGKQHRYGKLFLEAAAKEANSSGEIALVAQMGLELGRYDYALRVAKKIYRTSSEVVLNALYPLFKLTTVSGNPVRNPKEEIVLSIIRQESEFDSEAKSHVGARGLMQLMPRTAKGIAKKLGIRYSRSKLTEEPRYNVTLGSAYLAQRLDIYNGSMILSFAAYNAGEGNVNKWIKKNGDPRKMSLNRVIDWIELIPFSETNNYVQRVMENVQVYRYAVSNKKYNLVRTNKDLLLGR